MKMALRRKLILGFMIVSIQPAFAAQDDDTKLYAALEKIKTYLAEKKPDWSIRLLSKSKVAATSR
jgi:hypothetical protein